MKQKCLVNLYPQTGDDHYILEKPTHRLDEESDLSMLNNGDCQA